MHGSSEHPFAPALRRAWLHVAVPVAVALVGVLWIELALRHFETVTKHGRNGVIGYHYSVPEWGFEYRPAGRVIEKWSFAIPLGTTVALLFASALISSWRGRHQLGAWGIFGLIVIHVFAAAGFLAIAAFLFVDAAAVFI